MRKRPSFSANVSCAHAAISSKSICSGIRGNSDALWIPSLAFRFSPLSAQNSTPSPVLRVIWWMRFAAAFRVVYFWVVDIRTIVLGIGEWGRQRCYKCSIFKGERGGGVWQGRGGYRGRIMNKLAALIGFPLKKLLYLFNYYICSKKLQEYYLSQILTLPYSPPTKGKQYRIDLEGVGLFIILLWEIDYTLRDIIDYILSLF